MIVSYFKDGVFRILRPIGLRVLNTRLSDEQRRDFIRVCENYEKEIVSK